MDAIEFFKQYQDFLAPKLTTYEQAIYFYIFRHSRLVGQDEVVIGFKSARKRMALGIGQDGSPMSESTCYKKLQSLQTKGCIVIRGSERTGTRVNLLLPTEIPNIIPTPFITTSLDLEDMNFFDEPNNRKLILSRENHKCFYCLCVISSENYVIEHVVSRPAGNSSYRNVVAACRTCNNRKGAVPAEEFLRTLYRESFLDQNEFQARLSHLELLQEGKLVPVISQYSIQPPP